MAAGDRELAVADLRNSVALMGKAGLSLGREIMLDWAKHCSV